MKALLFGADDELILGGYASFLYLHGLPVEALEVHVRLLRKLQDGGNQEKIKPVMMAIHELAEKSGVPRSFLGKLLGAL